MKKYQLLILIWLSLLLSACSNNTKILKEDTIIKEEQIIEKQWTNSMEEIIVEWTISNMEDEKQAKIKLHKFTIPSMQIAIYDANPNNPEIIVEDEQFNSDSEIEIPYYEIETPLPDLVKSNWWFIKMFRKENSVDFIQIINSQDRKSILDIIKIDTNLDLWDTSDIEIKKSDIKDIVNINNVNDIDSYELVSSTSKYVFYIYLDKTKSDRYYLVWIADWCAPTPCSNIVSIEFLN